MARRDNSEFIDIRSTLNLYKKNWYWFLISIIVCGGLAFAYTKLRPEKMAVVANLLITPDETSATNPMAGSFSSLLGSNGQVDDEIFIVSSHSVYYKVAKELGINVIHSVKKNLLQSELKFQDYPVGVRTSSELYDTLSTGINFRVKVDEKGRASIRAKHDRKILANVKDVNLPFTLKIPYGEFTFFPTTDYIPGVDLTTHINVMGYHAAAEMLNEQVTADIASKLSNVIQLRMETPYVDYGKAVLNQIIKEYNDRGIKESASHNQLTAKFLDARLDVLARDLNESELAIQDYKEKNNIVDVKAEATFQTARREKLDEELIRAQVAMNIVTMMHDFISDPENRFKMMPSLGLSKSLNASFSESLSGPIQKYNSLINSRIEFMRTAKPGHRQLQILEEQIDAQQRNMIATLNQAKAEAERSMKDLENVLQTSEGYLATVPNQEREYAILARQNNVKQSLYLYLLQRREEVSLLISKEIPKGQIIDQAYVLKDPIGPRKLVILLVGLVLGGMIMPIVLYIRQLLRSHFGNRKELEDKTDLPVIGEIENEANGDHLVMARRTPSTTSENFRLLRSNLLFLFDQPSDKVIAVTSVNEGEGKAFISINIATSLAMLGKKVVLVGADLRHPKLANYLGLDTTTGLSQFLEADTTDISHFINPAPGIPGLDVMTAGSPTDSPAELLLSDRVEFLFAKLREKYDFIIVNCAPVGNLSDTFELDRFADLWIFVCRANMTRIADLRTIEDINFQKRLHNIALVLNDTRSEQDKSRKGNS